jgi:hypothetical protein
VDADQLRAEVRDFLVTRRGRITPAEADLPVYGGLRGVPGLRREELAMLAGLSVEYYSRLERGNLRGVSEAVLEALGRALRLSDAERAHLYDLARAANATVGGRRAAVPQQVRPGVQRSSMRWPRRRWSATPGWTIWPPTGSAGRCRRHCSTPPWGSTQRASCGWTRPARSSTPSGIRLSTTSSRCCGARRTAAPAPRCSPTSSASCLPRSETFRARWARHEVRLHLIGNKRLRHRVVGDLDLRFETMELPADPGLALLLYTPEPNSETEQALTFLASWAGGNASAEQPRATNPRS